MNPSLMTYPEWSETLDFLAAAGGRVLVIGETDCGKTSFCTTLANTCVSLGKKTAVVDADIGQSDIGPPACVSFGICVEPIRTLAEIHVNRMAFVGTTSPHGHLLELAVASHSMTCAALETDPEIIIIDTTGFVRGPLARRLKQAKIDLLAPDHIVVLQKKTECEPILTPYIHMSRLKIHKLPIPTVIQRKPPNLRIQRSELCFARYFDGGAIHTYSWDDIAFVGTWLNQGNVLEPHMLRFLSTAYGVRIFHAEVQSGQLGMVAQGVSARTEVDLSAIQTKPAVREVSITPAAKIHHLLVGLDDGNGRLLGLGTIEAIDFRRRTLGIFSTLRAPAAARIVKFGLLRLQTDGKEIGVNRLGEV